MKESERKCPYCGKVISFFAKICPYCGMKVDGD
jgi:uncharacterized Zn-finger protein